MLDLEGSWAPHERLPTAPLDEFNAENTFPHGNNKVKLKLNT